ncbi:hypothetical protein [Catellatospora tritici]|uniref:hypothetical protein n=1 Tax=Catellatospora tritici TaxID=2851566 RepID=UPI001C2DD1A6|nr:hypothetical protein [Catellatospora tritici]MBV1854608.1 hypothetical protein [Catellatospora tritici]
MLKLVQPDGDDQTDRPITVRPSITLRDFVVVAAAAAMGAAMWRYSHGDFPSTAVLSTLAWGALDNWIGK